MALVTPLALLAVSSLATGIGWLAEWQLLKLNPFEADAGPPSGYL